MSSAGWVGLGSWDGASWATSSPGPSLSVSPICGLSPQPVLRKAEGCRLEAAWDSLAETPPEGCFCPPQFQPSVLSGGLLWASVRFDPALTQTCTQIRQVRLFQDEEIYSDLYLTVCEWPSDASKVIVFGFK